MSPRSAEGRITKEHAIEEDDEQSYFEREEPEGDPDSFDDKRSLPNDETVSDEFTSPRPLSPFQGFVQEVSDTQHPLPPKKIIRAFEDRLLPNEQLDECTTDQNRVHEVHEVDLRGDPDVVDEAGLPAQNIQVDGVPDVAIELDENVDSDTMLAASPEQGANLMSRLTFWWINSLMWSGFKKPLEIVDLPSLPDWDDADAVHKRFNAVWGEEQQKPEPSLLKALYMVFWPKLVAAALLQLVSILLQFTPSIFLNSLLTYIEGIPTKNFMFRIFGQHFGYYTAAALLVVPTVRSLTDNAIMQIMFRLGMNMKTALIKTVYQKSLSLSNSARQSKSVGEIVILMQVDTEKVNGASPFLQNTWSALVQVLGNIALLFYYMGWSSMVGIGLLLLTIPLQGKVVQKMMLIQKVILKNTGRRVKVVNEVLQGIRVVKAYAWEEPFTSTINGVRALELTSMRSRVFLRALQTCLMLATPVLIMVVSFSIYAGVQKKNMTAATVFTSLSLFNSLRQPLMIYPFVINGVLTGYVSLKRLSRFMQSEEMHPLPRGPISDDKHVLHMENSTFQWVSGSVGGLDGTGPSSGRSG